MRRVLVELETSLLTLLYASVLCACCHHAVTLIAASLELWPMQPL